MSLCVFTICSKNYLHYARTLMESVRLHQPGAVRVVALCDDPDGIEPALDPEEFELLPMGALGIPELPLMVSKYSVLELNTAVKPSVFQYLLTHRHFDQVVYFDPDIRLYRDLTPVCACLESASIVLTPHITDPIRDERHPGEITFLLCGTYNLGFIAVKNTPEAGRLMTWWQDRLRDECVVDIPHGLFVDQKWANLIPGLFESVYICRDPGWNTAYWNLAQREITCAADGSLQVNQSPLFFFHFSGVNVEGTVFSSHQDRFTLSNLPEEVRALTLDYCGRLRENGAESYASLLYAYSRFPGGRKIPDFIRRIHRTHPYIAKELGVFSESGSEEKWMRYALEIPPGYHILNRAALAVYEMRIDLTNAFPDVPLGNELPYANWFVDNGNQQPDVDPDFVSDVAKRLQGPVLPGSGGPPKVKKHRFRVNLYRGIYRIAWRLQRWVTPLTSMAFRRKVHAFLVHLAYNQKTPPISLPQIPPHAFGVNLIGYLGAENGVGRAARLSIAAAEAAEIPASLRNFEVGCVSRKEELPEGAAGNVDSPYPINLFHINADQIPIAHSQLEPELFSGHYNIGFWYWELQEFPAAWHTAYSHLDEIWVATGFCQEAISRFSPVPVLKMPPGIQVEPDPTLDRSFFGLPEECFLFLTMADGLSFFERKNSLATVQAFLTAFPEPQEKVKLVVKVMNSGCSETGYSSLLETIRDHPSIVLIEQTFSRKETDSLLEACDAVVSLHRAEGFGLPLAEAMYLGKPVMATHWSGNTDFINQHVAYPVDYTLVALEKDYGPYEKGMHWAEPDQGSAVKAMLEIAGNGEEVRRRAAKGQAFIRSHYSPEAAGERMKARLQWILKRSWGVS
jgi:glycosyltransferase involved in cell wall biosynthesis